VHFHHECRERLGNIQRDIAPLFNGGSNIHTVCVQSLKESLPVGLGRDNDYCIAGSQSGFDKTSRAN
jgi:hypothetical protein